MTVRPISIEVGVPESSSELSFAPLVAGGNIPIAGIGQAGLTATVVVVTNVVGAAITREADAVCYLHAGPGIAGASPRSFR